MQKLADQQSKIDPGIVARFALGGLISGGSTMALVNLVRMMKHMNNYRKEMIKSPETDEDTIVLSLPGKTAEISGATMVSKTTGPSAKTSPATYKSQMRNPPTGTFSNKIGTAEKTAANWQTLTAATLATMGSAIAGVQVMNKLYQWKREKILKDKVEAARQEYMNMLSPDAEKVGTSLDMMFASGYFEKEAVNTFGMLNYPLAVAALLGILGAGGTGYVIKTMLDAKDKELENKGLDIPKIQRIIFKSSPKKLSPNEKHKQPEIVNSKGPGVSMDPTIDKGAEVPLTSNEVDSIKAALAVYIDYLDTSTKIMNEPALKQAMAEQGVTQRHMLKMAQTYDSQAYSQLMDFFTKDPKGQQLRDLFIRASMAKHPMLKHFQWASGLPGIRGKAIGKFNSTLENAIGPDKGVNDLIRPKLAGAGFGGSLQADITGSLIGSTMANQNTSKEIAKEILDAQAQAQQEAASRKTPEEVAENIQLVAEGPEAKEYLAKNKLKVRALLKRLVAQGKI